MSDEKIRKARLEWETIVSKKIEKIENNIDYARFEIQEQRISELKERVEGEKKECKHDKWTKCYDEDGNFFARWCQECGEYWMASGGEKEDKLNNTMFVMFDKRTHVLMKREDLQFLCKRLDWSFIIEFDEEEQTNKIKEEYGIE